jgi:amino acid transporter
MARQQQSNTMSLRSGSPVTGFIVGLIIAVAVALPFAAAVGFATNPYTRHLFSGRLADTSQAGYVAFWWLVAIVLGALPFVLGWAVTKLSTRGLAILGGVIVIVVIVGLVLGSLYVF